MEATEGTSDQEHGAAQFSPKQLLELLAEIYLVCDANTKSQWDIKQTTSGVNIIMPREGTETSSITETILSLSQKREGRKKTILLCMKKF
jgi:hypothetical protein